MNKKIISYNCNKQETTSPFSSPATVAVVFMLYNCGSSYITVIVILQVKYSLLNLESHIALLLSQATPPGETFFYFSFLANSWDSQFPGAAGSGCKVISVISFFSGSYYSLTSLLISVSLWSDTSWGSASSVMWISAVLPTHAWWLLISGSLIIGARNSGRHHNGRQL